MKKFLFFELFILFTIIGFLVGDSFAGEVSVFGPKQYLRTSGSPNNYSDNFLAVSGQGKLVVKNGVWNGTKRIIDAVSSASVYVNGELIFGPGDFNKNTYLLEQNIPLNTDNSISVELASSPESYITIEIIQDIAPPDVSLNAVPSSLFFGQSSLLTWASNTAETCMIEPGIGEVALNGSVAVFPSKTTTYTITATGLGGSTTAHISVIVKNSPPIANSQSISTNEDNELSITLGGSDIDNDPLTYEILNSPSSGSLSGTSPNLIYTPDENFNGEDSFTFKVNDGQIDSEPATISIIVNPINDPPAANAGSDQQVTRTSTVVLDGTGSNDIDGDTLSYQWSFVSKPAGSIAAFSDPSSVNPFFVADISGRYELELIVNDGTENSAPDTVSITVSPRMLTVPSVTNFSQSDAESAITATGLVVGTITTANSDSVPLNAVISQSPEGGVLITEGSTINLTVSIGPVSLKPQVNLTASPAMINQGELSTLTWSSTNGDTAFIEPGIGSVAVEGSVVVAPDFTTTYTITVTGTDGSTSKSVVVSVIGKPETQPAGSFGEQYNDLIPGDATVGSYDSNRFAMITGHVQDILDNPIMDVNITIFNHPEYGTAKTNEQGQFTIPVDGGGVIKLIYQKEGYITSHRQLSVPWNDFAIAETIQMITEDPVSTTLTFDGNPDTIVTHQSTPVTDESGTRSCSMVFQGDNQAFLVDENGNDVQELTTITTRATEYTTPESMPAFLPPTSAFTYCVELTVDGTQRVRFTKPVITWVDNFLGFEVGEIVPVGYYDRDKGVWIGTQNGAVVRLLDTDNDGIVDALDATGDNVPDDLNGNGSFRDEVTGLDDSTRYQPGATFWRVALSHFSPRDMNWPWGPPIGAVEPNSQKIFSIDNKKCEDCKTNSGSYVENRSRIMNEDIPITGTDMTLHYSSNRVKDYKTLIDVPVSGSSVPSNLKHIIVKCEIAGVITERILDPLPNQKATFIWDGMDLNGNEVKTPMLANISIGFV
ncbi:MAG: cadherin-like domain-containing protein, partial [Proteobacteria bacterium]|nr:cadherin-like domain-containing protein [Pseudomonadota bacterium]